MNKNIMKKFTMKTVQLSKKADLKIKAKLYILQLKKNFRWLKAIKVAIPALALWLMVFSMATLVQNNTTTPSNNTIAQIETMSTQSNIIKNIDQIKARKYHNIAKKRLWNERIKHYKQYAYTRIN